MDSTVQWINPFSVLIVLAVLFAAWIALKSVQRKPTTERNAITFGLQWLLYLSGGVILLGCLGYFIQMSHSRCMENLWPGSSFVTVVVTVTDSAEKIRNLTSCYLNSASLMMTAFLALMLIGLIWFFVQLRSQHS